MAEKKSLSGVVSARISGIEPRHWTGDVRDADRQGDPQGASEIAQAINSQANAYVTYGAAQQRPLEIEKPRQQTSLRRPCSGKLPSAGDLSSRATRWMR